MGVQSGDLNIFDKIIFGALQHNQLTITGYKISNHGTMAHTTVYILLSLFIPHLFKQH